jgi:V/A-type H+-transporting ATPase subunit F
MPDIAVIGDELSILGFKALGIEVFPLKNPGEAEETLKRIKKEFTLIFITESFARNILKLIEEISGERLPLVTIIPDLRTKGVARERLRLLAKKAAGIDIFKEKEG